MVIAFVGDPSFQNVSFQKLARPGSPDANAAGSARRDGFAVHFCRRGYVQSMPSMLTELRAAAICSTL